MQAGRLCTTTDEYGNTAIEVFNSRETTVDVIAECVNESIFRDIPVTSAPRRAASGQLADGRPDLARPDARRSQGQPVAIGASRPGARGANGKAIKTKVIKSHKRDQEGPAQDPVSLGS